MSLCVVLILMLCWKAANEILFGRILKRLRHQTPPTPRIDDKCAYVVSYSLK